MARIKSTYSVFVEAQEKLGAVVSLSHEATARIDKKISDAFSSAQKSATLRQRNSVKLMKKREL